METALPCQRDSGGGVREGAQADEMESKMKHYVPVLKGMSSTKKMKSEKEWKE